MLERDSISSLDEGLFYLYTASSVREIGKFLSSHLQTCFGTFEFSLLAVGSSGREVVIEFSTCSSRNEYWRPSVVCPGLAELMKASHACGSTVDAALSLEIPEESPLPVLGVRTLPCPSGFPVAVLFHEKPPVVLNAGDRERLDHLFYHVAAALDRLMLVTQLEERADASEARAEGIQQVSDVLGQLDLEPLLCHVLSVCLRLAEGSVGSVVLSDKETVEVEWGLPRRVLDQLRDTEGEPVLTRALREGVSVHVDYRNRQVPGQVAEEFCVDSVLCVPLVAKGRALGAVSLVNVWGASGGPSAADQASIQALSRLGGMAVENALLHRDVIERERFRANLELARSIQQGMYPLSAPTIDGYETAWQTRSCDETGGDYVDFLALECGDTGFAIGDVSGHGIGAALFMAAARAYLRALISLDADLRDVVERLNGLLSQDMNAEKFMTLFLAVLNPRTHELRYVCAGHDHPLVYRSATGKVEELRSTGLPLGMIQGWTYEVGSVAPLEPGDVLLLTTDGVWEALGPDGTPVSKARIGQALAASAQRSAQGIVESILEVVASHTLGGEAADDSTIVVLRRLAGGAPGN